MEISILLSVFQFQTWVHGNAIVDMVRNVICFLWSEIDDFWTEFSSLRLSHLSFSFYLTILQEYSFTSRVALLFFYFVPVAYPLKSKCIVQLSFIKTPCCDYHLRFQHIKAIGSNAISYNWWLSPFILVEKSSIIRQ